MYSWPRTSSSNDVTMHVDIHGYDTRSAENMDLYRPWCSKEIYNRSFLYTGSSMWKKLTPWVKEPTSLNDFKRNFRLWNGWIHTKFIVPSTCTPISYHNLLLLFYQFCLQSSLVISGVSILSWYCWFYVWFLFMNVHICALYIYIFYFVTGRHGRTV